MVQLLCKTVWQFLKKLKIEQQLHFWVHIQKYWKHHFQEISAHFIATLIHNSQKIEAIQKSIKDEQICKMWYIQIMEYYLALERKETLTHAIMDEPWEHHIKWKKPDTKTNQYWGT